MSELYSVLNVSVAYINSQAAVTLQFIISGQSVIGSHTDYCCSLESLCVLLDWCY